MDAVASGDDVQLVALGAPCRNTDPDVDDGANDESNTTTVDLNDF